MLLTLSTTYVPARDLGYLLLKHPDRAQSVELGFGTAHVFFPVATDERATCVLYVEVDPLGSVRARPGEGDEAALRPAQHVSERPYVASLLLSVAMSQVFGTALSGIAKEREALVNEAIPLEAVLGQVRIEKAGDTTLAHLLFEPLGYRVEVDQEPGVLTGKLTLRGTLRLRDLLRHLTVLVPVLDDEDDDGLGEAEVDKVFRRGEGWLAAHPEQERISHRYVRRARARQPRALSRLDEEESEAPERESQEADREEQELERPLKLQGLRMEAVLEVLRSHEAKTVADLGCGEGRLVKLLLDERRFTQVVGADVSLHSLERAERRLDLLNMPATKRARLTLLQSSLVYRDKRLLALREAPEKGLDAVVLVEAIEHLELDRLPFFEENVFRFLRPRIVVITTPNAEHNVRFTALAHGTMRHRCHRFEWTREELRAWGTRVALSYRYTMTWQGIGEDDAQLGPPTQMLVFEREEGLLSAEEAFIPHREGLFQDGEGV